jgi:hypothetical protein
VHGGRALPEEGLLLRAQPVGAAYADLHLGRGGCGRLIPPLSPPFLPSPGPGLGEHCWYQSLPGHSCLAAGTKARGDSADKLETPNIM